METFIWVMTCLTGFSLRVNIVNTYRTLIIKKTDFIALILSAVLFFWAATLLIIAHP